MDSTSKAKATSFITEGVLSTIINEPGHVAIDYPLPVCQVLRINPIPPPMVGGKKRFGIVLSDTRNFAQAILAQHLNPLIFTKKLRRGCFIRLNVHGQSSTDKNGYALSILDLEVIDELGVSQKIGEPTAIEIGEEPVSTSVNTSTSRGGSYGKKPAAQPRQRASAERLAVASSSSLSPVDPSHIVPIESLSPYGHRWTIKARVASKSAIKTWHKPTSEGRLFGVTLLDNSGQIKATVFNDQCDQLYDTLREGRVYYISTPCRVQLADRRFGNVVNEYELTFERGTTVEDAGCQDDVPRVSYDFSTLSDLLTIPKDSMIDVIGVLKEVGEVGQVTSKLSQNTFPKRELTLVDNTGYSVRLTIWGNTATRFDAAPEAILACKGVRVGDFGGRSLSLVSSGSISVDPDLAEAHQLKGWFESKGRTVDFKPHSDVAGVGVAGGPQDPLKTVAQVYDEQLGMRHDSPDYFSTCATVIFIKQDPFCYPACANEGCNKKVTAVADGCWRCEKCSMDHARPQYRFIMSLGMVDHTSHLWVTAFDDVGRQMMGMSADELMQLKESDTTAMEKAFDDATARVFRLKVRAKQDTFGEQTRVRYQAINLIPYNFTTDLQKMVDNVRAYNLD